MPPTSYDALVAEIDRIISSPYPCQLRTLRDIAVSQCTEADISQWVAAKPCLVQQLASCLLEGLQQWPYVLEIVTTFSFNGTCRDAFLQQEPTLLHSLISRAVRTGDSKPKYAKASIALLSLPLPQTVALPAEAQTLFVQLVELAAKHPSAATIEPVYFLLSGTGNLLLGVLSTEVLIRFEEQLIEILRNSSGAPDHCVSLYCLSIMNVVCCSTDHQFRLTASSYNTQDFLASTPTSSRWNAEAMHQFFTGSKAQRSMQLIVALALWATNKSSSSEPSSEKMRCLILINEVVTAIPSDLRKNWCSTNAITIRKLQEKLCVENQDETAKTLALRFLGKLCELDMLPHPVLKSIELTFLEPKKVQIAYTLCPRVDDSELFSDILARAPVSLLLQNAVDFATRTDGPEILSGLDAVTRAVQGAACIIEQQKITGHEIRATLNDAIFVEVLQRLRDITNTLSQQQTDATSSGWCGRALHRMRSKLAHQVSNLLLRACHSSSMSQQCMTLLLDLYACSARGDLECSHSKQIWTETVHITDSTDAGEADVVDWREALHTHFKIRAGVEQDAVSRLFARACVSLEARCENVEAPLRQAQEKHHAVEEHNKALSQAYAEMEARNIDLSVQIRGLEEEHEMKMRDLEERADENSALLDRVAQLEQKLREAHAEGECRLAELNTAKHIVELDGASAVAKKQEELDDMQEQLEQAMCNDVSRTQELSGLRAELADAKSERECLTNSLASCDRQAKEQQDRIHFLEQENGDLKRTHSELRVELETAAINLASSAHEVSRLRGRVEDATTERERLQAASTRHTEEVRRELESNIAAAQRTLAQVQADKNDMHCEYEKLQHELHDAQDLNAADIETRDLEIADYKKKVERLQRKCEQKDEQIAEAEAMRTNLMAVMGLSKHATLPHRSRESMPRTQDDPTPPTPASGDPTDIDSRSQDHDIRSSPPLSREPTPKRPRPRRSAAAAAKSRASAGTRTAQTQAPPVTRRQTLGVVSGNRASPKPVSFKTPNEDPVVAEADESTFEGSDLFTGTQGARMVDLQKAFGESE